MIKKAQEVEFYEIIHKNSKRIYPRVSMISDGLRRIDYCKTEHDFYWEPYKQIRVNVDKVTDKWPDHLSDYHWEQYYMFSEKVIQLIEKQGYLSLKSFNVFIENAETDASYYLINGLDMKGAEIDYKKSELTYRICKECKTIRIDVESIVKKIKKGIKGNTFLKNWNGKCVFSIGDEKGWRLYCTNEFINICKQNNLTNISFRNILTDQVTNGS